LLPNLERVNAAAKQAAQTRFTALLHHVDEDALLRAFQRQRQASARVDWVTVAKYEEGLTDSDGELTHERARSGFADIKALLIARRGPSPKRTSRGKLKSGTYAEFRKKNSMTLPRLRVDLH
jgi:hypothetical protein